MIPLGLTSAASATVTSICKKLFGSCMVRSIVLNKEEVNNIIEIAESLKEFSLLIKDLGVFLTIASKTEAGEQKREFFGMLLDSLGASSLGNLLTGIGTIDLYVNANKIVYLIVLELKILHRKL